MDKVKATIGVLRHLEDELPNTILIVEKLLQQNENMHGVLKNENERLRLEIQKEQEAKEKLKASERARTSQLEQTLAGRESEKQNIVELESKLAMAEKQCAELRKELQDAQLEKSEAVGRAKIIEEQLNNQEAENGSIQRQLAQQKELVDDMKKADASRLALVQEQNKELAEQTDKAQSARRAEDITNEDLKLKVMQLKQSMKIMREILSKSSIDANTRSELESAMSTKERKPDGLTHKIKF